MDLNDTIAQVLSVAAILIGIWISNRGVKRENAKDNAQRHDDNLSRFARVESRLALMESERATVKESLLRQESISAERLTHLDKCIDELRKTVGTLAIQMAALSESQKQAWELIRRLLDNATISPQNLKD